MRRFWSGSFIGTMPLFNALSYKKSVRDRGLLFPEAFFTGRTMKKMLPLMLYGVLFFSACEEKAPRIVSIDPRIAQWGEVITIEGDNFGTEQEESYITIAGTPPVSSGYLEWGNTRIRIQVPEFAESGLVYVHKNGKKSNPLLFSNRASIPELVQSADKGIDPIISSIKPGSGAIGSLITIQGSSFGISRENGGVFFAWNAETPPSVPVEEQQSNMVEVFETEFGYELWNDREIRVRVPDGAASGNIAVSTSHGKSSPIFFTITGMPGTKTFKEKRSYTITYTVNIQVHEAQSPNTLYLWVPHPVSSASQRIITVPSRTREPFVEHYQGTTLFQLNDLSADTSTSIGLSYTVEVYAVETNLRSQTIRQSAESPIQSMYTRPGLLIPSDTPDIVAQTAAIIGKERNPYEKARKIYEWLIKEGGIQGKALNNSPLEALQEKQADAYSASLLFCAMARSAEIPAIPVAGVLINRSRLSSRHYWAEFWIDGFGWVPVDPALGAGVGPSDFNLHQEPALYYFGNLDNQRIAFSRGQGTLSQMDPRGRITAHARDYALQNLWEEAIGGLESYSSFWSDVTIAGME